MSGKLPESKGYHTSIVVDLIQNSFKVTLFPVSCREYCSIPYLYARRVITAIISANKPYYYHHHIIYIFIYIIERIIIKLNFLKISICYYNM